LVMQAIGTNTAFGGLIGMLTVIATAVLIGFVNGFAAGYLKIAPFIVTLATMSLARGLTLTVTDSSRVVIDNDFFNYIGLSNIVGKVPASLLLVIAAYIAAFYLLRRTVFGRRTYAIGDNPVASRASGINVEKQTLLVYMVAGIFIGLSTIILLGRSQTAQPLAGIGMEFEVITAVVLGGVSLFGGIGNLKGTILGVILISVIFTGLGMLDIPPFVNYLVKGSLILIAVLANQSIIKRSFTVPKSQGKKEEIAVISHNTAVIKRIQNDEQQILSLKNISKSFPGVKALENVSLDIKRGKVHALCGENGAGKSTLMKILSGVYTKDAGEILIDGNPVTITSPIDSEKLGISIIYQELANIPELPVYNNVNLGKEITRSGNIFLHTSKMISKTTDLLKKFDLNINVNQKIERLTVGQQQMVEIAKAYGSNTWVMVMDEPTSAISESDKNKLFGMIRELKEKNVAIIYISHRMNEIFEIADEITILRDGQQVITGPIEEFDENKVIMNMVGRDIGDVFKREKSDKGDVVLEVKDLSRRNVFQPISFTVRAGEVLGFSGLIGAGRTEIMRCIFGLDQYDQGEIFLKGEKIRINSPDDGINAGILLVSEDRRREGIIPNMVIRENITLASLPFISKFGWINKTEDHSIANEYIKKLNIRTPSTEQLISNLSGGNQQKVCLAKWLALNPKIIIMDEPTRGIDVGAKAEIHKLIEMLTKQGIAVIMISSEMPEIMGVSDRIIVLHEGKVTGEFVCDESLTQEMLMKSATGI
ncbi:MAG TPA: ATP-binding cassette domain-containing protein, partial [Anaerovoracaceae bacterium]|nr:ATP-binding cassette domain-containing protein [Anaerovoracaceae bacterium]